MCGHLNSLKLNLKFSFFLTFISFPVFDSRRGLVVSVVYTAQIRIISITAGSDVGRHSFQEAKQMARSLWKEMAEDCEDNL